MGRAGLAAPRTCSTLELRTHTSPLTVTVPATAYKAGEVSPPSPGTPILSTPASVRPVHLAWPKDALEVVHRQMEAIRSQSIEASELLSFQRSRESSEIQKATETAQNDDTFGLEVSLRQRSALPEDWEQFLDLKTGQFYYFNWSSCKRTKQDPRELILQANKNVREHMRGAHLRGQSFIDHTITSSSQNDETDQNIVNSEAGSCPPDVCERTSEVCSVALEMSADRELGNSRLMCRSSRKEVDATNVRRKERKSQQTVMVVSGCHSCSAFVMLCLSSPACPSCGVRVPSEHGGIR